MFNIYIDDWQNRLCKRPMLTPVAAVAPSCATSCFHRSLKGVLMAEQLSVCRSTLEFATARKLFRFLFIYFPKKRYGSSLGNVFLWTSPGGQKNAAYQPTQLFFFFLKKKTKTKRGHSQSEGLFIVCISVDAFRCLSALETLWPANGELSSREGCGCQPVEAPVLRSLARWERSSLFSFSFSFSMLPPPACFTNQYRHAQSWGLPQFAVPSTSSLSAKGRLLLLCLQSFVLLFNPVPLYGLLSHV